MISNIVIDNSKIKISQKNVIGSGGEAVVLNINNKAIKLYHQVSQNRINKISRLIQKNIQWPGGVCFPEKLVFDNNNNAVGFVMDILSGHYEPLQSLSSKNFRRSNPTITNKSVVQMLLEAISITDKMHKSGIVIGDYNDLNILFNQNKPTFIDIDSVQFENYPCFVGTEHFLPPELYNIDLSSKCYFTESSDYYSWFCIFIRSILLVHPYGGIHPKYNLLTKRALDRITFLDKDVVYPKAALSPDLLNNNIKSLFEKIFIKGERHKNWPTEIFQDYYESLIECTSCKTDYPSTSKQCPICSAKTLIQINKQTSTQIINKDTVLFKKILSTTGAFVWHKICNDTVYAIAIEKNLYILYKVEFNQNKINYSSNILPFIVGPKPQFDILKNHFLLYCNDTIYENNFQIIDINNFTHITKKPSDIFVNKRSFVCTNNILWRLQQGFLIKGKVSNQSIQEESITSFPENQTIILPSRHSDTIFAVTRMFSEYKYFWLNYNSLNKSKSYFIPIPVLQNKESLIDITAYHFDGSTMLLEKTEQLGKTYTRRTIFKDGNIVDHIRVPAISSDIYNRIHGKEFITAGTAAGMVLHTTDFGIIQEKINTPNQIGHLTTLQQTKQYVSNDDVLAVFQSGVLVFSDTEISYLELR